MRWFCALACFCVSGGVIAFALFPAMKQKKAGIGLLALLLAAHLGFSCGFMLVFFHAASTNNNMNNAIEDGGTSSGIVNVTTTPSGVIPVQDDISNARMANLTSVKPRATAKTETVAPKKKSTTGKPAVDSKTKTAAASTKAPVTAPSDLKKNQTLSPT